MNGHMSAGRAQPISAAAPPRTHSPPAAALRSLPPRFSAPQPCAGVRCGVRLCSAMPDYRRIRKGEEFQSFDEFELHFKAWKDHFCHPFRIYNSDKFKMGNGEVHPVFKVRAVSYHCSRYGTPRPRGQPQSQLAQQLQRPSKHLACGCKAGLRLVYSAAAGCLRITTFNDEHNGHRVCASEYQAIVNKQYKALFHHDMLELRNSSPQTIQAKRFAIRPPIPNGIFRSTTYEMVALQQQQHQQQMACLLFLKWFCKAQMQMQGSWKESESMQSS